MTQELQIKEHVVPDGTPMALEGLATGVKQLMDRIEKEKEDLSAQELILDDSNEVSFPGFSYKFEASIEKIIVSIDVFKSGYECKVCKGKKKIEVLCSCEAGGHAGLAYGDEEIKAIKESLGNDVADARKTLSCRICSGDYVSKRHTDICTACKGKGAMLILPDDSKNLPTTGVVVSIGSQVPMDKINYKVGSRVLFGPYSGSMIPTKAGLMMKIMDWNSVMCRIKGAEDLAAFDFILQEGDD
jgi:co-chaperonin GroES (HSP10)